MKKILLISSANPFKGPGAIGKKMYDILREYSAKYELDVDMLTTFEQPHYPEIKYIYKTKGRFNRILTFLKRLPHRVTCKFSKQPSDGYYFFYRKETNPPVPSSIVLDKIKKDYDIIIVYFWQGLLSFKTISDLYDRYPSKFIFICADYSPMSGGCHFTNGCEKFIRGCGACTAFNSSNIHDFTRFNVGYRKKVYDKVNPIIWANTYMIEFFFKKSYLLKDQKLVCGKGFLDTNLYRPVETESLKVKYNIPEKKKFIISFGCQSLTDERKGMSYMIEALNIAYERMTEGERQITMLLAIGNEGDKIKGQLKLDYKWLGYISVDSLPEFYSVSNVFVCSSINDAGPSMLKQSLACGTPLVAFEMGAALDVLVGQNTGISVKLRDSQGLAEGILTMLRMPKEDYDTLRKYCRDYVLTNNSRESFVKQVLSV